MGSCYWLMEELPGISSEEVVKFQKIKIYTTKDLLKQGTNFQGKKDLANKTQLNVKNIAKWVALADLARIKSVGCKYCGLLLHSGIASVEQLVKIPVHRLHRQILRLQVATMQRKDLCPSVGLIKIWIKEGLSIRY